MPGKQSQRAMDEWKRAEDEKKHYEDLIANTDFFIQHNATSEDRETYYEELGKLFSGKITLADCTDFTIANDNANIVAFLKNLKDTNASAASETLKTVFTKRKPKNRQEMKSVFKMLLTIHNDNAENSKKLFETIQTDFKNKDFLKYSCMPHIRKAFYATQTNTAQKPSEAGDE